MSTSSGREVFDRVDVRRPAGTAITSSLPAKTVGFSTRPSLYSWSGSLVFAAAYTSGFTPWRIWAASSSEPAKL